MDIVLKGFLQGSIPVVVFVGGAHHLTKKFKASKPVLYYGSLLAGLGLAYAVVEGKIKAPFMNAEEDDLYYCSKCDEGFSSINPTDEGQFCDSCLPSSATLHDEMERMTMDAETFDEYSSLFEIKIPADSYDVGPDSQLRKWIRSMEQKGYSHILRRQYYTVVYDEEGNKSFSNTPEYLIFDIREEDEITYDMERDLNSFDELMIYGSEKMERVFINYDRSPSLVKPAINPKAEYIPVMDYEAYDKTFD